MRTYTSEEIARGVTFAWAYHRKLRAYLHRPYGGAFGRAGPQPADPNFVHFVLGARLADRLGVPFEDYIEAHFWAEQRHRGRHPQPRQLHREKGWTAAERVATWRRAQAEAPTGRALADGVLEEPRQRDLFAVQERYLEQLCASWLVGPDEILRALGGPAAGVFDAAWLRTKPVWRELERQGHFAAHPEADIVYLRRRRDEERARRRAGSP